MKIIWSTLSLGDLRNVQMHIAGDSTIVALQVVTTIVSVVEKQLGTFPKSGRPGRVPSTYILTIAKLSYIVQYRIVGQSIEIARAYHTSRQRPDSF